MSEKKTSRHSKKAEATRNSLLAAAARVIAQKGYSAATVGEIAKEAGVSKGLAYYHFKNKADLASAILTNGVEALLERFETLAAEANSAAEALSGMFDAFVDAVVDNREFGRFFFAELWREGRVWSDEMRVCEARLLAVISGQFRRGQEEGSIDSSLDADFGAVSCIGIVLTTALCYFGDSGLAQPLAKEAFAERVRTFVKNASFVPRKV